MPRSLGPDSSGDRGVVIPVEPGEGGGPLESSLPPELDTFVQHAGRYPYSWTVRELVKHRQRPHEGQRGSSDSAPLVPAVTREAAMSWTSRGSALAGATSPARTSDLVAGLRSPGRPHLLGAARIRLHPEGGDRLGLGRRLADWAAPPLDGRPGAGFYGHRELPVAYEEPPVCRSRWAGGHLPRAPRRAPGRPEFVGSGPPAAGLLHGARQGGTRLATGRGANVPTPRPRACRRSPPAPAAGCGPTRRPRQDARISLCSRRRGGVGGDRLLDVVTPRRGTTRILCGRVTLLEAGRIRIRRAALSG